jgi:hypothetical protein
MTSLAYINIIGVRVISMLIGGVPEVSPIGPHRSDRKILQHPPPHYRSELLAHLAGFLDSAQAGHIT